MNEQNNETEEKLTADVLYAEPELAKPSPEVLPKDDENTIPPVSTSVDVFSKNDEGEMAVEKNNETTPPPRKPRKPRDQKPETSSFEEAKSVPIKKRKKASGSVNELAGILAVLHTTAFAVMGASHMDLSKEENTALAQALDNLADEYEITVDSKSAAWINLGMIAGSIYGARFFMSKPFQEWMNKGKNNESTNYPA